MLWHFLKMNIPNLHNRTIVEMWVVKLRWSSNMTPRFLSVLFGSCCPPNISSHLFHPLHPHISTSWLTPLRQIGTHPLWSMSPNINPSVPHLLLRPQEGLDTWHHTDVRIVWLSVEVICKYWHIRAMKACIRSVVLSWFCFKSHILHWTLVDTVYVCI